MTNPVDDAQRVRRAQLDNMRQELREPVNAIIGYGEMIHEEATRKGLTEMAPDLDRILSSARELSGVVNQLLDIDSTSEPSGAPHPVAVESKLHHDLREPLNAIMGYTEMLLEDLDDVGGDALRSDLTKLLGGVRRLSSKIDIIINFSREYDKDGIPGLDQNDTDSFIAKLVQDMRPIKEKAVRRTETGSILVVDDSEITRDLFSRRLLREGHRVTTAESGRRALEIVEGEDFDLILLDLMMPDIHGFQVLERLKTDIWLRDTPVIVLSSLSELDAMARCIEAGAEDYLMKPVDPALLIARVGMWMEKKRLHKLEETYLQELESRVEERTKELSQQIEVRKRAEESLRKLSQAVEQSPAAIFITDTEGTIEYVNPKFVEVTGYTEEEAIGENPRILKSGRTPPELYKDLWGCITSGREWRGELQNKRKNGELYWEWASISPIRAADGTITHFLAVNEDITERKESQAQLIQASKLATLGEMATAMAHELNQPLNVIRMAAYNTRERIAAGKADSKYLDDKLERISAETERASEIIDHMRIFGRKADEKPKNLDLREMVSNALGLMGEQLRLRTIEVETRFPERCREISGHPVLIEQVLLNLLGNARDEIEANRTSPEDPRKISLTVEDMGSEDEVRIVVEDTGGGIPEDVMPHIFEPFFTTKEPGKGTGLGLSVSYGIMRDLGGRIEAANVGQGAQFTMTLPAVEGNNRSA